MSLILVSLLNFVICFFLIKLLLPIFNKYYLCAPILRSSHKKPLPTGAGIVFSFISSVFSGIFGWYIPLISFPISLIGFIDDKQSISRKIRYFSQIVTAFLLIYFSNNSLINLVSFNSNNSFLFIIFIVILVFLITAIINFFNFMDGIDGFVASIFTFYLLYLSLTDSTNKIFLMVSLISFLFFNWKPARIFMGDSGSTFIGSVYVGTLLETNNFNELFLRIIILSPLLGDAFITLILRILNKQNIFKGHKLHLYQRLNQAGMDHDKITILYLGASILLCLTGFYGLTYSLFFVLLIFLFGVYLNNNKAVPFDKYY